MDKFITLQLFTKIVDLGSFSKAADQLGIPRATASNAIKDLEGSLGCRLLERTTRHVRTSLDGQIFYNKCLHILDELDEAESSLRQVMAQPHGILRVDLPSLHAAHIILPRLNEFHKQYPEIELVISSRDRSVDLIREGIDCVVRAGRLQDSSLVARRLATIPQVVCASPEYLKKYGKPNHPDELKSHQCINFFSTTTGMNSVFEFIVNYEIQPYLTQGWMSVSDAENYVIGALQGAGLIQLPRYSVMEKLKTGELVEVLAEWKSPELPISVLYPYHRQLSPRVRVFVDWLIKIYQHTFNNEVSELSKNR